MIPMDYLFDLSILKNCYLKIQLVITGYIEDEQSDFRDDIEY